MPQPIRLFNTLTRQVEVLQPLNPDEVSIYTCGPTVYGRAHVGNLRSYIYEDVLIKTLNWFGYKVKRVMNITDVGHLTSDADQGEDKLELGARREQLTAWEVAKKYERLFLEDAARLNLAPADQLVRATESVPAQINFIVELEKKGYTYRLADGLYFDSSKIADYGRLAKLDPTGLRGGARVPLLEGKRHLTDFALWKFSPTDRKREMEWESPWGKGFPGWHIECSAIIRETLGEQIDIHCGGADHVPVHHTNERAQSLALTGKEPVQIWSHGAFLTVDGGKMSKSLQNDYTLADLDQKGYEPLSLRYFTYGASYRASLNFTWDGLGAAAASLRRLRRHYLEWQAEGGEVEPNQVGVWLERFRRALADDLNLPVLLADIWELSRSTVRPASKVAALNQIDAVLSLDLAKSEEVVVPLEVEKLLSQREAARKQKDWEEADRLRREIEIAGFGVEDRSDGARLNRMGRGLTEP